MIKEENTFPKFDDVGNLIKVKPEISKIKKLEGELEELINGKEVFCCQYCDKEWDKKRSNVQHESWCDKNSNNRRPNKKAENPESLSKKKTRGRPKKEVVLQIDNFTVEELRKIDRTFGLTDEQIVNYIRDKKRD